MTKEGPQGVPTVGAGREITLHQHFDPESPWFKAFEHSYAHIIFAEGQYYLVTNMGEFVDDHELVAPGREGMHQAQNHFALVLSEAEALTAIKKHISRVTHIDKKDSRVMSLAYQILAGVKGETDLRAIDFSSVH